MNTVLTRSVGNSRFLRRGGIPKGCLIALGIFLALAAAVIIFVLVSWKGWVASGITAMTTQMVTTSSLPQDQKDKITTRVNKLADDFKNGKISIAQLQTVATTLAESPLMPFAMVQGFEKGYLAKANLKPEEQKDAERTLERFARGVFEKKIPMEAVTDVMVPISDPQVGNKGNNRRLRQPDQVTPEQVKEFIALAKGKADAAKIADEPFTVNVAEELIKAIDEGVGQAAAK